MMIVYITDRYYLWRRMENEYVVTTRKRKEVFNGTLEACEQFMAAHPYDIEKGAKANESIV